MSGTYPCDGPHARQSHVSRCTRAAPGVSGDFHKGLGGRPEAREGCVFGAIMGAQEPARPGWRDRTARKAATKVAEGQIRGFLALLSARLGIEPKVRIQPNVVRKRTDRYPSPSIRLRDALSAFAMSTAARQ